MVTKKNISKQEVERIAKLSRLGLTPKEISQATKDLNSVLEHFSEIQKIDTSDTQAADDVTGLKNITRDDEAVSETLCDTSILLDNAPETLKGQIKVKAVFEP